MMKTHKKALCEEERHRKQEEPPRKRRLALNYLAHQKKAGRFENTNVCRVPRSNSRRIGGRKEVSPFQERVV